MKKILKVVKNPIFLTFIFIAIIRIIFYSNIKEVLLTFDSHEYIAIQSRNFFYLIVNFARVPLYPILIDIFYGIFKDRNALLVLCYFQAICSFISLYLLYLILKSRIKNIKIIIFILILYGCSTVIMGWDYTILTESLSLSIFILLLFLLNKYIDKNTKKLAVAIPIVTLTLIFLKPSYLVFIGAIIIFFTLKLIIEKNRSELIGVITSGASIVIILMYCYLNYLQNGIFVLSGSLVTQQLTISMQREYYKSTTDNEIKEIIEKSYVQDKEFFLDVHKKIIDKVGIVRVNKYNKEVMKKNFVNVLKDSFYLAVSQNNKYFTGYYTEDNQASQEKPGFTGYYALFDRESDSIYYATLKLIDNVLKIIKVHHAYILILIQIFIVLNGLVKNRKINLEESGYTVFLLLIVLTAIFGTNSEYPRTMISVLPIVYILMAKYLNSMSIKKE
ncbi:MAG: hypothetical protein N2749_05365 [Clostridia bacterium]|nr:hypothetical protein [Clostridia bacterium]